MRSQIGIENGPTLGVLMSGMLRLSASGVMLCSLGGILDSKALAADQNLKPLTVCDVLDDLPHYVGKIVPVLGRLSSNLFDGAWLSEGHCSNKVEPIDPNWPYAIYLGCPDEARPPRVHEKLEINKAALQAALSRLRKTTTLKHYDSTVVKEPSKKVERVRKRETWSIVLGRIVASPQGQTYGAVRARAELCAGEGAALDIEDPDSGSRQ